MLRRHAICSSFLLLILSLTTALAQNEVAKTNKSSAVTITASASGERVRFTAPSSVVQIRLEIYNSTGKKLFDNEVRGGNVLDWHLQDGQAEPLADDSYLCMVTVKSLSGKLTQRIGSVRVEKSTASVEAAAASRMTAQQTEAIGPVEENASVTVLTEGETQTATVIAHNGTEGQLVRGQGALSFRLGDFFSGKDTEQMRLTPEGNLGIGITHPRARLDVDGLIRTSQGIVFSDGTIQTTAANGASGVQAPDPNLVGGKLLGSTNQSTSSAKDGKGKNKVSPEFNVNEDLTVNGNIIFTPALARDITMQQNIGGIRIFAGTTLTALAPTSAAIQFFGNGHGGFPGQAYIDSGAHDQAAVIFRTTGTGGTITERMRVTATGNVGIGTASPGSMLTVAGVIESKSGGIKFPDGTGFTTAAGLRLESNATSPNVVGGFAGNSATAGAVGATIGGGGNVNSTNRVTDEFGTVGGGANNQAGDNAGVTADRSFATVGGGEGNTASGSASTVGGGAVNTASGGSATVGGGAGNTASGNQSTVGGGSGNGASDFWATVGGGKSNTASGQQSTVGGGEDNTGSGTWSTVPGGLLNTAQGSFSFAAGRRAKANHFGAFVWADSTNADFTSTGSDQFLIRASGGVGIGTAAPAGRLQVVTANDTNPTFVTAWDSRHFVIGGTASSGGIGMSYDQTNNVGYITALSPSVAFRSLVLQPSLGFVGIGTTLPNAKLQVAGGDAAITTQGNGLILRATDGTNCFRLTVKDSGVLNTSAIACP